MKPSRLAQRHAEGFRAAIRQVRASRKTYRQLAADQSTTITDIRLAARKLTFPRLTKRNMKEKTTP